MKGGDGGEGARTQGQEHHPGSPKPTSPKPAPGGEGRGGEEGGRGGEGRDMPVLYRFSVKFVMQNKSDEIS